MKQLTPLLSAGLLFGLFAAAPAPVHGAFMTPPFRGDDNTEHAYWDIFTDAVTSSGDIGTAEEGNLPDSGTGDGVLYQTAGMPGQVFVTSTANLYSPFLTTQFELHDTPEFTPGMVFFQFQTSGVEADYSSFSLNIGGSFLSPDAQEELSRVTVPDGQGGTTSTVDYALQWDLTDDAALFSGGNDYVLNFSAGGPHMSFQAASLDSSQSFVAVIPEPNALLLAGLGGALLICLRRRRTP